MTTGTMGNPLKAIGAAVPERIREARAERDKLVVRVCELSQEIATLETLQLVGGEAAAPVLQVLAVEEPAPRARKHPEPPQERETL